MINTTFQSKKIHHITDMVFGKPVEEKTKRLLFNMVFVGFLAVFIGLVFYMYRSSISGSSSSLALGLFQKVLAEEPHMGRPVRISIPKIKIDAPIEEVRLMEDSLDAPKELLSVGWYNNGTMPGENGTVTMNGHFEPTTSKKAAAFDKLYTLHKGDAVYVTDENGNNIAFIVRETRKYNPETDSKVLFDGIDKKSHLNLITSEGTWNQMTQSYSNRMVVFADKETK